MIDAEPAHASSIGTEPAGAAPGKDTGHESKPPAACDSPGSPLAQAAAGKASADGPGQRNSRAEAARPGCMPEESGAPAAAGSAGGAPRAGIGGTAAGLSLNGRLSSTAASTGDAATDGFPLVASSASNDVAASSTAHMGPSDGNVWDGTDGISGREQTSSAQNSPLMPCKAIAAGTAAALDSAGQLPSLEAGNSHREASSSACAARAGKQQAAHDGQDPGTAQVCSCGPTTPNLMPPFRV